MWLVGKNGWVPRNHQPAITPSESVRASIDVFQVNRLRAEIIRDLASHPEGSTTGDVGRRIDVDYRQIHKHVRALATQGIVGSSISSPGTGRHILYTLNRSALESNNKELLDYLLGK